MTELDHGGDGKQSVHVAAETQEEMAKCPKCKESVDYLRVEIADVTYAQFTPAGDYDNEEYVHGESIRFECPECGEVLFDDDEDEAYTFLNAKADVAE